MLKPTDKKNIIIKDMGPITVLGNISGPILKPFPVKISDILHLVVTKYHVFEVLPDGETVKLTVDNYNKPIKPKAAKAETADNTDVNKESVNTGNSSDSNKLQNNSKNNKSNNNNSNNKNDFYQKNNKEEQKK